jgi:hypothetical protein
VFQPLFWALRGGFHAFFTARSFFSALEELPDAGTRNSTAILGSSTPVNTVQQVIKSDTEWTGWFVFVSKHTLIAAKGRKLHFDPAI